MVPCDRQGPIDARAWPVARRNGDPGLGIAVKAAFVSGGGAELSWSDESPTLEPVERYAGSPEESGPLAPGDLVPEKRGCDVWVAGAVQPEPGSAIAQASLSLWTREGRNLMGPKTLWAVAERGTSPWGLPALPTPLAEPIPLRYELAYGGPVTGPAGGAKYGRNPVGRGCRSRAQAPGREPDPLLVWPQMRSTWRGMPAGLGPLAAAWVPRAARWGRLDDAAYRRGALRLTLGPGTLRPMTSSWPGHLRATRLSPCRGWCPGHLRGQRCAGSYRAERLA